MGGYINKSGNYRFEELGVIHVNVRQDARTIRARWKGGSIVVSAYTGIPYDELLAALREFMPRLEVSKPSSPYYIGQTFDFGELRVRITSQSHRPDHILAGYDANWSHIDVGTHWDMSAAQTIKTISKFLCRMAQVVAPGVLIPRAKEIAQEVNCHPLMWNISKGHRVLGHCSSRGEISLSYALIFYPHHLRDYVIKHELAHLTEMNHSVHFHQICDRYCGGAEKQLERELKAYSIPIIR